MRRLVVVISPRRPGLEPGPVLVDFVGDSDTGTGFSSGTSAFPSQYHCTIAPSSIIHLPLTLYV